MLLAAAGVADFGGGAPGVGLGAGWGAGAAAVLGGSVVRSTRAVGGGSIGSGAGATGLAMGLATATGSVMTGEVGGVPAPNRAGLTRKGGRGSATAEPAASASKASIEPGPNCPRCD